MQKTHLLYWGYSFHEAQRFKALRERRRTFKEELIKDAKEAGLIK